MSGANPGRIAAHRLRAAEGEVSCARRSLDGDPRELAQRPIGVPARQPRLGSAEGHVGRAIFRHPLEPKLGTLRFTLRQIEIGQRQERFAARRFARLGHRQRPHVGVAHVGLRRFGRGARATETRPDVRSRRSALREIFEGHRVLGVEPGHLASVGEQREPERRARDPSQDLLSRGPRAGRVPLLDRLFSLAKRDLRPGEDDLDLAEPANPNGVSWAGAPGHAYSHAVAW